MGSGNDTFMVAMENLLFQHGKDGNLCQTVWAHLSSDDFKP
jgi:hypothetical protein